MPDASTIVAGGCQCGTIRFTVAGVLPPAYACHCGDCKKQSSSAFSMSIVVAFSHLTVVGEPVWFKTMSFSGAEKLCYFCPTCGSRLWHISSARPLLVTLKVGTLDHCATIAPRGHLWISKLQAGISLDPSVPAFDTQPDDINAWREGL
jgi:hypothetical protein